MKKFLSLVLALVMTMSLVTVSAGAKDFGDSADLSGEAYEEAVNVMSEMGIIDGYSDGDFRPQGTLTRQAAAKIIACMMLGKTTAEALGTSAAPFKDVPAGSTFAGYIAYCVESGLIDGYADGTFRPQNTLTGFAFLKMLLTALGYDSAIEGYTGANWTVNVAGRATQIGLTDGNEDFVGSRAATREEACLYAVNALKATLVEYESKGTNVTVNGATVAIGASKPTYITSSIAGAATSIDDTKDNQAGDYTVEFAERYQPDLELDDDTDPFGRPSHTWSWKGHEIGSYIDYDLLVAEYTTEVTGKDLYDAIGRNILNDDEYSFLISIDGETDRDVVNDNTDNDAFYFTEGNLVRGNTNGIGGTGDGVLTQVFVDTESKDVYISVINTYLAIADGDYDERNDELDLDIYALENVGDSTNRAYVKNTHNNASGNPYVVGNETVSGEDFAITDYVDEDIILVTVAEGEVQTIADPEVLDAVTLDAFKQNSYVETEGTQYDYADTIKYDPAVLENYTGILGSINLKDITYNLILDQYGYLIGIEQNEDPDVYLFLSGLDTNASNLGARTADANVIFTDGTMDTVEVDLRDSEDSDGTAFTVPAGAAAAYMNTWCTYTVDDDGVYTLTKVEDGRTFDPSTDKAGQARYYHNADKASTTSWYTIDTRHPALAGVEYNDATSSVVGGTPASTAYRWVYGNDESIYIAVEVEGVKGIDNATNVGIITDVDSVVTGIDNANLDVYDATYAQSLMSGCTPYTQGVYTLFDDEGYVIAAVVVGEDAGATTNYAYVTSSNVNYERYDGKWSWTREVVINGELTDITYTGDALDEIGTADMTRGSWYEVKYYADGTVKSTRPLSGSDSEYNTGTAGTGFRAAVADIAAGDDTVLLEESNPGALTLRGSMLYTSNSNEQGIYIDANVKVVRTQNVASAQFDEIEEYTGVDGLEDAINDMYDNFAGTPSTAHELVMIVENGRATSIILVNNTPRPVDGGTTTPTDGDLTLMNLTYNTSTHVFEATIGTPVNFGTCNWSLVVKQGGYVVASASSTGAPGASANDVFVLSTNAVAANLQNNIKGEYTATITINDGVQVLTGTGSFTF